MAIAVRVAAVCVLGRCMSVYSVSCLQRHCTAALHLRSCLDERLGLIAIAIAATATTATAAAEGQELVEQQVVATGVASAALAMSAV
jgi:hypothetical protein